MLLNNQFSYDPLTGISVFGNHGSNTTITSIQERIDSMSKEPLGKDQTIAYLKILEAMKIIKVVHEEENGPVQYELLPDVDEVS